MVKLIEIALDFSQCQDTQSPRGPMEVLNRRVKTDVTVRRFVLTFNVKYVYSKAFLQRIVDTVFPLDNEIEKLDIRECHLDTLRNLNSILSHKAKDTLGPKHWVTM